MFEQLLINGIITGSIYAIVALGFALVYNTTHIFHIAYAALYMASPYFVYLFYKIIGWPVLPSIIIAVIIVMLLSLLIEWIVYQPLEKKRSSLNVILISSLGVMIIFINIIAMLFGNEIKILNQSISDSIQIGEIIITHTQFIQFFVSTGLILIFFGFLKFSKFGMQARAMRDNESLSSIFGLKISKFRLKLFALSSIFASAGGILMAWDYGMDPYVGFPMLLNAVVALIIGGVGKFHAPVIGGFILGILHALTIWKFSANWLDAVSFGVLIIFLLFRPQGLFGEKLRLV